MPLCYLPFSFPLLLSSLCPSPALCSPSSPGASHDLVCLCQVTLLSCHLKTRVDAPSCDLSSRDPLLPFPSLAQGQRQPLL